MDPERGIVRMDTKSDGLNARPDDLNNTIQSDSPPIFWCYCLESRELIENYCAKSNYKLD